MQVFSLITFIYAVVSFFKLITLASKARSNPMRLDPASLLKWQGLRRRQYLWMMFSGFGVLAFNFAVFAILTFLVDEPRSFQRSYGVVMEIGDIVVGLAIIYGGWLFSAKARGEADEMELTPLRDSLKY